MRPRPAEYGVPPSREFQEAPTADLSGRCIGNSYLLVERIGDGATGQVWRALDRATGDQVAIKMLREELLTEPRAVTRFVQERAILLMLRHPHIVRVRDMLAVGDSLGLVMDLVDGGSLRGYLRERGTLPPADAADLLHQVAEALVEAHQLGVVHRDLKPDNILLDQRPMAEPHVKLTDFGIARVLDSPGLTTPQALIGTPNYLAPELINGAPPTPAVDVYALGILFYELLAGRTPYAGAPAVAVLRRHVVCSPDRPAGIPDVAWQVVLACTAKDPADRPSASTVATMMASVVALTAGQPAAPPAPPPPVEALDTDAEAAALLALAGQLDPAPAPAAGPGSAGRQILHRRSRRGWHRWWRHGLLAG
ncbi:MAG TPA: serine/threonine-protein kinase, partial [Pilimelia sp.]|nr:serine/threonine-protein kinase [Pilimelia sp.]